MTNLAKEQSLEVRPSNFENRLFFQARNLAIEAMLLRIEGLLLRQGFDVRCVWEETSFTRPTVEIRLFNPKKDVSWEYAKCCLRIDRGQIKAIAEVSSCFYTLRSVETSEYWPRKQPQRVLDFRAAVDELAGSGYFAVEVAKVNFPFDYQSHSSF